MKIIKTIFILFVLLSAMNVHAATEIVGGLTVTDGAYLEKESVVTPIDYPQTEIVVEDSYIKSDIVLVEENEALKPLATSDIYVVIKNFIKIFAA